VVTLARHDHPRRQHHQLGLSTGRQGLRDVQVHLIAVEVSIVRCSTTQVQPERRPVKDFDLVSHDAHLVQRRLTVEQDDVVVTEVPFDDRTDR